VTRLAAYELLRAGGTPTRSVARMAEERGFDARDRAFLRRLVATEVRRRGSLHAIVRHFARGRPNRELATFLRIGCVQLLYLDQVPDHAALAETVRATADALGLSKARYVNAVLRSVQAARRKGCSGDPRRDLLGRELHLEPAVFHDPTLHPLLWGEDALSMPAAILKPWSKRLGLERAFELARAALHEPPLSIRCTRGTREELALELARIGVETRPGGHSDILLAAADRTEAVLDAPAFRSGRITIQGETALRAAELGGAQPGERWLDLCAAPGGKTAVLAAAGAEVVGCDLGGGRLERLRSTLARLELEARVRLLEIAAEGPPPPGPFEGVLVDAPCSNTGVLAQRPEARWSFGSLRRTALARLQERLLDQAAECVAPGGRLVYATCSIEPEENERRVRAFLGRRADFSLAAELAADPAPDAAAGPVDGGFAALLRRAPA
jgi:16S rRNA (cytosine967-C5)-methyltransferase